MNIRIKTIEVYHPENQVSNDFYLDHFKKLGKDIDPLLKALGREKRYIIDTDDDNTLTMGIKAAKKALKSASLEGKDIDMVLFSSQLAEYTMPSQALIVHNAINGKKEAMCMDTNTNCIGMLVTIENTIRSMLSNPHVERALVIGSDYISIHCKKDDEETYPNFGDAAVAVILEKVEDQPGFIDGMSMTNGSLWETVKFPACGLSNVHRQDINSYDKHINWIPFNGMGVLQFAVESIHKLLNRNNLKLENIDAYCFSQFGEVISTESAKLLDVDINKFVYIGNEYGYTGTSSPFIALYEGIKRGKIKRGDLVCFWSVGINWTINTLLMRY